MGSILLILLAQFVPPRRVCKNGWLVVLACAGVFNLVSHGMSASGVEVINLFLAALFYKVWSERIKPNQALKWLLCVGLIQMIPILLQSIHYDPWFGKPVMDGWKLPHGFMPVSPIAGIFMASIVPLAWVINPLLSILFLIGV